MKSLRRSLNNEKSKDNNHSHDHNPSSSSSTSSHAHTPSPTGFPNNNAHRTHPSLSHNMPNHPNASASTSKPTNRIAPPQKVIRAIQSHRSEFPQFPSYAKGEFFYVTNEIVGDESNPEGWFEALNPVTGSRGRVTRAHFEEFGKTGKVGSGGGGGSGSSSGHGHGQDVGSSRPTSPTVNGSQMSLRSSLSATMVSNGSALINGDGMEDMRSPEMGGAGQGGMRGSGGKQHQPCVRASTHAPVIVIRLYAIVQYDFEAERPDELDAKAGEPIIVIAQSNHEWFVAKPIGRLGGPGLIPVSFVEIRDPKTSRPVENVQELLATGGPPQVEAWKKATADYKAASIPLGQFDFANKQGVQNSPYAQQEASMPGMARTDSGGDRSIQSAGSRASWARHQRYNSQQQVIAQGGHIPGAASQTDAQLTNGEVMSTHVRSFHYEASSYWFRINVIFMPDDPSAQAISLILYRLYEDFYNFQITLLNLFPGEAGRAETPSVGAPPNSPPAGRILPYMPGPLDKVDVDVTNQRREELDTYLKELLDLRNVGAGYVLRHEHVLGFFSPGAGDAAESMDRIEAETIAEKTMRDGSGGSIGTGGGSARHMSGTSGGLEEKLSELRMSTQGGRGSGGSSSPMPGSNGQYGQFDGRGSGGSKMPSIRSGRHDSGSQPGMSPIPPIENGGSQHQPPSAGLFSPPLNTASTQSSFGSGPASAQHARTGSTAAAPTAATPPFIKIKILERTTDDMIAIRVPPRVNFEQLMQKVRDRLGSQVTRVQYRQSGGSGGGAATFRDIGDDSTLKDWLGREDKLVLYAD